jgi:NAD(P)-dependent dehydrogenase (short-subunit alcohol dehydrogenase family)
MPHVARGVIAALVASAFAVLSARVGLEFLAVTAPEPFAAGFAWAATALFVAGEFTSCAPALFVAVEGLVMARSAMTAAKSHVAGFIATLAARFAAIGLLANNSMPESVERRTRFARGKLLVRAARTGKAMVMTHLGTPRECLKMYLKIYILRWFVK